ncbi:MAG: glycosyltransferase family 4 protein [Planctomycetota bacterium]|nr:glycosyltransferase family 4 protein [Planctomycetota bacterium]
MRIGIYTSIVASEPGYERNVSAHIQIPLHSARLLREAGHDVHLISNQYPEGKTLPACLDRELKLHLVTDSRKRQAKLRGGAARHGIRPLALFRQLSQIKRIAREQRLELLHVFGFDRSAQLAGLLKAFGLKIPSVVTLIGDNIARPHAPLSRWLLARNDAYLSATRTVIEAAKNHGFEVQHVSHGAVRQLTDERTGAEGVSKNRVLFWRDPSPTNGADLCLRVFETLAPEFPAIDFDFAVRRFWNEIDGLDEAASKHENIHVHRFPYPEGITLPDLVLGSMMVVMPFRELSIQPQLAILESLAAGVPVLTSDLKSNRELIQEGINGALLAEDEQPYIDTIRRLLVDSELCQKMGENAARSVQSHWNWDRYVDDLVDVYKGLTPKDAR